MMTCNVKIFGKLLNESDTIDVLAQKLSNNNIYQLTNLQKNQVTRKFQADGLLSLSEKLQAEMTSKMNSSVNFSVENKLESKNDMDNKQESQYSYLYSENLSAAEYISFINRAKRELKDVILKVPGKDEGVINDESLNKAIRYKIKQLLNKIPKLFRPNHEIFGLEADSDDFYDQFDNFINNIDSLYDKDLFLILKYFDSALHAVLSDYIKIPSAFFNYFNKNKQYSFSTGQRMANNWTADGQDINDMEQISGLAQLALEVLPMYKFTNDGFELDNDRLLDFTSAVSGFNLFQVIIHNKKWYTTGKLKSEIDFDEFTLDEQRILKEYNIKTYYELFGSIRQKISDILPIAIKALYISPVFSELLKTHVHELEALRSFYEGMYNNEIGYRTILPHIFKIINQVFNSITDQNFLSYIYEDGELKSKFLAPKTYRYDELEYSNILRNAHSSQYRWFSDQTDLVKDNGDVNFEFTIPQTKIHVIVEKNSSTDNKLQFTVYSEDDTNNKISFSYNTKLLDATGINIKFSIQDLATIIQFNNNDRFKTLLDSDNAASLMLHKFALSLIRNHVVNELIQSMEKGSLHPIFKTTVSNNTKLKTHLNTLGIQNANIRKDSFQVDYNNEYSLQAKIMDYYRRVFNKTSQSMVEDGSGNLINKQKLSQRGNLVSEFAIIQQKDVKNPSSHFILYDCYEGGAVLRDVKNKEGDKKVATDFNTQEHFTASFIYDYINRLDSDQIAIMGPVVSDKPWIDRILININSPVKINGISTTWKNILKNENSQALLKGLIHQEFGKFYKKQFAFVKDQITKLHNVVKNNNDFLPKYIVDLINQKGFTFDYTKWFTEDNSYLQFNVDINQLTGSKSERIKLKRDIIHSLIIKDQSIEWIENLQSKYDDLGNLIINPLLEYNLKRYKLNDSNSIEGSPESIGWFNKVDDYFISDLLKNDISTYVKLDQLTNDKSLGKDAEKYKPFTTSNGYLTYGTIQYKSYTYDEGSTISDDKTWSLTNYESITDWSVYKELSSVIRYFQNLIELSNEVNPETGEFNSDIIEHILDTFGIAKNGKKDYLDELKTNIIDSPKFSIKKLITLLNDKKYNDILSDYHQFKQYKETQLAQLKDTSKSPNDTTLLKNYISEKNERKITPYQRTTNEFQVTFNPLFIEFNLLTMLFQEEYLNSTVGTYLNHPTSGNTDEMLQKAIGAQVKRNVSLSATKHQYLTDELDTISSKLKWAVIPNLSDFVYNLLADGVKGDGTLHSQFNEDGATLVDGSMAYLENSSLGSNAVGLDKKQFGAGINVKSGTGWILKTAGFALSNDLLRKSPELQMLSKKLRSLKFMNKLDLNYIQQLVNRGEIIKAVNSFSEEGVLTQTFYKLTEIENIGNTEYIITWTEVGKNGIDLIKPDKKTNTITLNTIQSIYENVFGGMYACKLSNNGVEDEYTYHNCDISNEQLARLMHEEKNQFLKDYLISYAPTIEAMKQGATNVNLSKVYTDEDYVLTYFEVDASDLGVQLNAEHEAFENRVTLMTQVMNAASARGYSIKKGDGIYEALYRITQLTIRDCFDAYIANENLDPNIKQKLNEKALNKISSLILDTLKNSQLTNANLLDNLSTELKHSIDADDTFNTIKKYIPIDDPSILRQILSKMTVAFQNNAVRLKFPGGQYVLAPSNSFIKLYNGKTLEEYGGVLNDNVKTYLENLSENQKPKTLEEIRLGHAYKVTYSHTEAKRDLAGNTMYDVNGILIVETKSEEKYIVLNSPDRYWELMNLIDDNKNQNFVIKEDFTYGCDLGTEDFIFYADPKSYNDNQVLEKGLKRSFHIWDLYEVRRQWELTKELKLLNTGRSEADIKNDLKQNQLNLQKQLNRLTDQNEPTDIIIYDNTAPDKKKIIQIDRSNVQYVAFEAILPKYLKKRFGLTDFDTLSDVKNNQNFFYDRTLNQLISTRSRAKSLGVDIVLKGTEYDLYLKYSESVDGIRIPEDFREEKMLRVNSNGNLFDAAGNIICDVPLNTDGKPLVKILSHKYTGEKIIVTSDPKFFIEQKKFTELFINNTINENDEDSVKEIKENRLKAIYKNIKDTEEFNEIFQNSTEDEFLTELDNLNEDLNDPKGKPDSKYLKYLRRQSRIKYNSFLDSLGFIASRTPAQCHQSFMAMKCVAFDHTDRNVAYVSRWQLWLQGSDFDIDKVNIISHHVQNGRIRTWSPFQNYSSSQKLVELGNQLPLPTNEELIIETGVITRETLDLLSTITDDNQFKIDVINALQLKDEIKNDLANTDQPSQAIKAKALKYNELLQKIDYTISEISVKDAVNYIRNNEELLLNFINYLNNIENNTIIIEDQFENIRTFIKELIDSHNLYIVNQKSDTVRREIYENYISKTIWQVSIDPRNWIQGQKSVDATTDAWKDIAKLQLQAEESKRYIGASILGTINTLKNTLEGKQNVGIVANSLKNFEALSHNIYTILQSGNYEEIAKLCFDLKIHNKHIQMIANAWVNDRIIQKLKEDYKNHYKNTLMDVSEILESIDQYVDAFLEISTLLSLAVDNAKDPTLSKINGNKTMIGLYTTGLMLGLSKEDLIDIINSDTGRLVAKLMQSNIFTGNKGFEYFDDVMSYFSKGPKQIQTLRSEIIESLSKLQESNNISEGITTGLIQSLQNSIINGIRRKNLIQDKAEYKSVITVINDIETVINNLPEYTDVGKLPDLLSDLKRRVYDFNKHLYILKYDTYEAETTDAEGNPKIYHRERYFDLVKLMKINSELKLIQIGTKLNQGYKNSIDEQLTSIYNFESIISKAIRNKPFIKKTTSGNEIVSENEENTEEENSENVNQVQVEKTTPDQKEIFEQVQDKLGLDKKTISFFHYMKNTPVELESDTNDQVDEKKVVYYRDVVTNYFDSIKWVSNPFKIFQNVKHYRGYLEGLFSVIQSNRKISTIYNDLYNVYPMVFKELNVKSPDKKQVVSSIEKFFHIQRNKLFFRELGNKYTFSLYNGSTVVHNISLNTEHNRRKYKEMVELYLLPYLKKQYTDNIFIQSLSVQTFLNPETHNIDTYVKSSIQTTQSNTSQTIQFESAKEAVNKLLSLTYNGTSVLDILFIYNLISTNNLNVPGSLSPFFENIRLTNKSSIIQQFDNFEKDPRIGENPVTSFYDESYKDELLKFCAKTVSPYAKDLKTKYVWCLDQDSKEYKLYVKEVEKNKQDESTNYEEDDDNNLYEEQGLADDIILESVLGSEMFEEAMQSEEQQKGAQKHPKGYKSVEANPVNLDITDVKITYKNVIYSINNNNEVIDNEENVNTDLTEILQNVVNNSDFDLDKLLKALNPNEDCN